MTETDPDSGSSSGSGSYVQIHTSEMQKTPPIAVLQNNQLTIDHTTDNELYFAWEVHKPTGANVQNNWVIEEQQTDGTWTIIHSMECKNDKNSYTHPLPLEKERRAVTKTYRVRNTFFEDGFCQDDVHPPAGAP